MFTLFHSSSTHVFRVRVFRTGGIIFLRKKYYFAIIEKNYNLFTVNQKIIFTRIIT